MSSGTPLTGHSVGRHRLMLDHWVTQCAIGGHTVRNGTGLRCPLDEFSILQIHGLPLWYALRPHLAPKQEREALAALDASADLPYGYVADRPLDVDIVRLRKPTRVVVNAGYSLWVGLCRRVSFPRRAHRAASSRVYPSSK
jgi:hypothetical protein